MQKCVVFQNDNRFPHSCQGHFPNPGEAGAAQKMAATSFNTFNYTRFCTICQIKIRENVKIPQFLEILTQRAVGCQIKLTILLLMIPELPNFVNFFVKKNSAVSVFHRYRFGFCRD